MGSLLTILLQVSYWMCRWKNYENRSIFSEDMDKSIVSPFLTHGVELLNTENTWNIIISTIASMQFPLFRCCLHVWNVPLNLLTHPLIYVLNETRRMRQTFQIALVDETKCSYTLQSFFYPVTTLASRKWTKMSFCVSFVFFFGLFWLVKLAELNCSVM